MKYFSLMQKIIALTFFSILTQQVYAQVTAKDFVVIKPDQVVWGDAPAGVKTAILYGDPNKPGMYVVRNIFPEGIMSSPHFHTQDRFVTVIKGVVSP
jgi:hypothetical protein